MRYSILAAAVSAAAFISAGPASAEQKFDGNWAVELTTDKGHCNRSFRLPIVVEGGKPRYGGFQAGSVSANGSVAGTIANSTHRADFRGLLSGERGTGTWSTSGALTCSGRWAAEKRG